MKALVVIAIAVVLAIVYRWTIGNSGQKEGEKKEWSKILDKWKNKFTGGWQSYLPWIIFTIAVLHLLWEFIFSELPDGWIDTGELSLATIIAILIVGVGLFFLLKKRGLVGIEADGDNLAFLPGTVRVVATFILGFILLGMYKQGAPEIGEIAKFIPWACEGGVFPPDCFKSIWRAKLYVPVHGALLVSAIIVFAWAITSFQKKRVGTELLLFGIPVLIGMLNGWFLPVKGDPSVIWWILLSIGAITLEILRKSEAVKNFEWIAAFWCFIFAIFWPQIWHQLPYIIFYAWTHA